jgi:hypothetical protein
MQLSSPAWSRTRKPDSNEYCWSDTNGLIVIISQVAWKKSPERDVVSAVTRDPISGANVAAHPNSAERQPHAFSAQPMHGRVFPWKE